MIYQIKLIAMYSFNSTKIKKSKVISVIRAAANIAGEKLYNETFIQIKSLIMKSLKLITSDKLSAKITSKILCNSVSRSNNLAQRSSNRYSVKTGNL